MMLDLEKDTSFNIFRMIRINMCAFSTLLLISSGDTQLSAISAA